MSVINQHYSKHTHPFTTLEVAAAQYPTDWSDWRAAEPRETNGLTEQRPSTRKAGYCLPGMLSQTVGMFLCFNSFVLPTRHHTPPTIYKWRQNCSQQW